jgi:uncharacterized membrane protein
MWATRRRNIKLYLPATQVALAGLLLSLNLFRHSPLGKEPWEAPERLLCYGINAPASLLTSVLMKLGTVMMSARADYLLDLFVMYVLYLILVAALWYFVAIEISSTRTKGSGLTPLTRIRRLADLALIGGGVLLASVALMYSHIDAGFAHNTRNEMLFSFPCLLWGLGMAMFYGWDFYIALSAKTAKT